MAEVDVKLPYKIPTCYNWQQHATFYHPLYAGSIDGTDLFPHDKAVVRAMLSTYKPNKNVSGDQSKTLFVARLSKDTTQDMIQNMFEKFGDLENCRLIRDFVTGFSRGYAFVEFKRKKDALSAVRETHQMNVDGRQILVDFECERTLDGWIPRRFGGGFGGRKESGQLRFGGIDRPFRKPLPPQVNHFARGGECESDTIKTSQDSRGNRDSGRGNQQRLGRDGERHHSTRERDRQGYDKDRRGYDRDRDNRDRDNRDRDNRDSKSYKTDRRGDNRDREGDYRSRRGGSKDREDDDRGYRDRRDYKERDRDYRGHRDGRRDRDDRRRTERDRHDRDDRYRDRRHTDGENRRDTRDEAKSESSNSSKDPE